MCGRRSGSGCGDERIYTLGKDFGTYISTIEIVKSNVDLSSLIYVGCVSIIVCENAEHFLEEHTTKDYIV